MNTLKEFAQKLNGVEYMEIPNELLTYAKENGIVIVSGASDDLCELEGAVRDEFGCYDGGTGYLDEKGNVCDELKSENTYKRITAIWCGEGDDGFTWTYNTDIPHEDFEMFDDGEKYCRGFVFYLDSLKANHDTKSAEFLRLVKQNPNLPIVAMVDSEIVADDGYSWWLGSFKSASVDEYVSVEMYGDNVFYTRDQQDEIEEHFYNRICDEWEGEELSDEEVKQKAHEWAESLSWKKAIIVWISLPEM